MPADYVVGARGFEPPASASRTLRANQAALRPDYLSILPYGDRHQQTAGRGTGARRPNTGGSCPGGGRGQPPGAGQGAKERLAVPNEWSMGGRARHEHAATPHPILGSTAPYPPSSCTSPAPSCNGTCRKPPALPSAACRRGSSL